MTLLQKKCEVCKTTFNNERKDGKLMSPKQFYTRNFCSLKCSGINQRGVPKPKHTKEWREWFSQWLKENHPNRKEKIKLICNTCGKKFLVQPCYYDRKFCSKDCFTVSLKGRKRSDEVRKKISKIVKKQWRTGKRKGGWKISEEKNKEKSKRMMGKNSPFWRGGKMKNYREVERIRNSPKYVTWRKAVFKRDNYTCVWCGDNTGGNLNADHIKRFSEYPELRFDISNGRTLCIDCHKKTDTWGTKGLYGRKYFTQKRKNRP